LAPLVFVAEVHPVIRCQPRATRTPETSRAELETEAVANSSPHNPHGRAQLTKTTQPILFQDNAKTAEDHPKTAPRPSKVNVKNGPKNAPQDHPKTDPRAPQKRVRPPNTTPTKTSLRERKGAQDRPRRCPGLLLVSAVPV